MKTTMKKIFSLMLVAVLLVGVMPFQANASEYGYYYVETVDGTPIGTTGFTSEGPYTIRGLVPAGYEYDAHIVNNGSRVIGVDESFIATSDIQIALIVRASSAPTPDPVPDPVPNCNVCNEPKTEGHECARATCDVCKNTYIVATGHNDCLGPAVVNIQINNSIHGGTFTINAGKNANDVFAAYQASGKAALHPGAYGPVVTLDDMVTHLTGNTEAGQTYYLFLSWSEPAPENPPAADPETPNVPALPEKCGCGAALKGDACEKCMVYYADCQCNKAPAAPENHQGEFKFVPKFNDGFGKFHSGEPVYVKWNATMGDVFAQIPVPADYKFHHWSWDVMGQEVINSWDHLPTPNFWNNEFTIYAQYSTDVQTTNGFNVYVNLNHDWMMGETLKNVAWGSRMRDVMTNIQEPVRWGYKFAGWYWDAECKNPIKLNDQVFMHCTIFAKWEKKDTVKDTMLKVYLNGNGMSAAKIIDMHDYAKDGWITLDEVKTAVSKYYKAKDSKGMAFYGVYDAANWNTYLRNHLHAGSPAIAVEMFDNTTVYVMVYNAKDIPTANADKTNPKTGDMIMMPAAILGVSASALAVLFYLNKKRAI